MATQYDSVSVTLSAATGFGGTFTASYPTGRGAKDYLGATGHRIHSTSYQTLYAESSDFTIAFGASNITITVTTGKVNYANGSTVTLELDRAERDDPLGEALAHPSTMTVMTPVRILLGAPITADPDGICASQSATGAHTLSINGALASDGTVTLDVPRALVADSGGADTAVLTITGTDVHGAAMTENITLNGATAVNGKKAFKTITSVTSSATIANGAFLGTTDILGLPVFVSDIADVIAEYQDGAKATAGTIVAGVTTTPTATTGDVRGTYDPNAAANGTIVFEITALVRSTSYKGATQFSA